MTKNGFADAWIALIKPACQRLIQTPGRDPINFTKQLIMLANNTISKVGSWVINFVFWYFWVNILTIQQNRTMDRNTWGILFLTHRKQINRWFMTKSRAFRRRGDSIRAEFGSLEASHRQAFESEPALPWAREECELTLTENQLTFQGPLLSFFRLCPDKYVLHNNPPFNWSLGKLHEEWRLLTYLYQIAMLPRIWDLFTEMFFFPEQTRQGFLAWQYLRGKKSYSACPLSY